MEGKEEREERNFMEKVYKLYQVSWKFQAQAVIKASLRLEMVQSVRSYPSRSFSLLLLQELAKLYIVQSDFVPRMLFVRLKMKQRRKALNFPSFCEKVEMQSTFSTWNSFLFEFPPREGWLRYEPQPELWKSSLFGIARYLLPPPDSLQN